MLEPKHLVVGQRVEIGIGEHSKYGEIVDIRVHVCWDGEAGMTSGYVPVNLFPEDPAIPVDLKLWFTCPKCGEVTHYGVSPGKSGSCHYCKQKVRF